MVGMQFLLGSAQGVMAVIADHCVAFGVGYAYSVTQLTYVITGNR